MIWSDYIYFSWLIQLNLIKGNYYYNTKNLIGSFASSCPPYFNRFKRFFLSLRSSFHFWFCFFFSSSYSSSFSFPSSTSWMLFLFLNFFLFRAAGGVFCYIGTEPEIDQGASKLRFVNVVGSLRIGPTLPSLFIIYNTIEPIQSKVTSSAPKSIENTYKSLFTYSLKPFFGFIFLIIVKGEWALIFCTSVKQFLTSTIHIFIYIHTFTFLANELEFIFE